LADNFQPREGNRDSPETRTLNIPHQAATAKASNTHPMRTSRDQNRHRAFPITTHGVALSAGIQDKSAFAVAYVLAALVAYLNHIDSH